MFARISIFLFSWSLLALMSIPYFLSAESGTQTKTGTSTETGTTLLDVPTTSATGSEKKTQKSQRSSLWNTLSRIRTLAPYEDDASSYRFVSKTTPLSDVNYIPSPLVSIATETIDERGRYSKLRKDAAESLWELSVDFEETFHTPLVVISGYRSAAYQQRMWDLGKCSDSLCAPPGSSEHQLGLAVDLFEATTADDIMGQENYRKYINWMQRYAHLYGWHQSYQKGEAIDHYDVEPWHWRYLGKELATYLKKIGWTYTEYIEFQKTLHWMR